MPIEALQPLLTRWRGLQPRERVLIAVAGGALLLFLLYASMWRPMQKDIERLSRAVPRLETQYAAMQAQARQIQGLRARAGTQGRSGNLLTAVEQAAIARGLRQSMTKMEPDGDDAIRLTFEQVGFNNVLKLIDDLHKQNGLRIETASIEAAGDAPGIVNVQLNLRGAP